MKNIKEGLSTGGDPIDTGTRVGKALKNKLNRDGKNDPNGTKFAKKSEQGIRIAGRIHKRYGEYARGLYAGAKSATFTSHEPRLRNRTESKILEWAEEVAQPAPIDKTKSSVYRDSSYLKDRGLDTVTCEIEKRSNCIEVRVLLTNAYDSPKQIFSAYAYSKEEAENVIKQLSSLSNFLVKVKNKFSRLNK